MNPKEYILGMDIGGTNIRMGLVNRRKEVFHVEVVKSKVLYEQSNTVQGIINVIKDYCDRNLEGDLPLLISAGFPSVVDKERKRLYSSTNLPGLDGINIVEAISNVIKAPVIIQHDAYYLLAYDIYNHNIKNEGTLVGFYFGTGMGNAIYINGYPYIGKNGTACEVGHMPVPLSNKVCSCGNIGCIEMYCCGKAFEKIVNTQFSETPISDVFDIHSEDKVLDQFIRYMAVPIATEINILDPDVVIIGGGIVQMKKFPKQKLIKYVLENTRKPHPATNIKILFSNDSHKNGIIGAGIEGFKLLEEGRI